MTDYENSQLFPPGTQRPLAPLEAVQASCFKLVLATQHWPEATGRLPFCRFSMVAAEARATRAVKTVAKESCMVAKEVVSRW